MLKFVIVMNRGVWDPIPNATEPTPTGHIYEMRSIPGGLVGVGRTPQDAMASLTKLIGWTLTEEPSPEEWYRKAWTRLRPQDEQLFASQTVQEQRVLAQPPSKRVGSVKYSMSPVAC